MLKHFFVFLLLSGICSSPSYAMWRSIFGPRKTSEEPQVPRAVSLPTLSSAAHFDRMSEQEIRDLAEKTKKKERKLALNKEHFGKFHDYYERYAHSSPEFFKEKLDFDKVVQLDCSFHIFYKKRLKYLNDLTLTFRQNISDLDYTVIVTNGEKCPFIHSNGSRPYHFRKGYFRFHGLTFFPRRDQGGDGHLIEVNQSATKPHVQTEHFQSQNDEELDTLGYLACHKRDKSLIQLPNAKDLETTDEHSDSSEDASSSSDD